jgi:hypothetical protein
MPLSISLIVVPTVPNRTPTKLVHALSVLNELAGQWYTHPSIFEAIRQELIVISTYREEELDDFIKLDVRQYIQLILHLKEPRRSILAINYPVLDYLREKDTKSFYNVNVLSNVSHIHMINRFRLEAIKVEPITYIGFPWLMDVICGIRIQPDWYDKHEFTMSELMLTIISGIPTACHIPDYFVDDTIKWLRFYGFQLERIYSVIYRYLRENKLSNLMSFTQVKMLNRLMSNHRYTFLSGPMAMPPPMLMEMRSRYNTVLNNFVINILIIQTDCYVHMYNRNPSIMLLDSEEWIGQALNHCKYYKGFKEIQSPSNTPEISLPLEPVPSGTVPPLPSIKDVPMAQPANYSPSSSPIKGVSAPSSPSPLKETGVGQQNVPRVAKTRSINIKKVSK